MNWYDLGQFFTVFGTLAAMDNTPVTVETSQPRFRPLWVSLLICLIGMFGTLMLLQYNNPKVANEHALLSSGALAESASLLLTPLIVNEDRISINYLLNEMVSQPVIRGMRLTDSQGTILGLSGSQQGQSVDVELLRNEELLGTLEVWADGSSLLAMLQQQQTHMAIGAGVTLLFLLIILWIIARPRNEQSQPEAQDETDQFNTVMQQFSSPELDDDAIPSFDPDDLDSLDLSPIPPVRKEPVSAPKQHYPSIAAETPIKAPAEIPAETHIEKPAQTQTDIRLIAERDVPDALDQVSIRLSSRDDDLNDDELVSLLRPERDTAQMPRFTPATAGRTRDLDQFDDEPWVELEERKPAANLPQRSNPLLSAIDIDEEPSNVYAFEQDLELMLPATEAGYLLLIDTTSAHSELVEEDEHTTLLTTYLMLANSVSSIYNGRVVKADNGDLQIIFDQTHEDDTHGVNAMCAAMLFTHLYKQYNHSRIRLFRPVMNLHMALVRGKAEKLERLLEEARFLTRTTQSNELISHTALTESPQLKETLLDGANIRREDEDKVLVLHISQSYQELLEKQSKHLMSKMTQ